MKRMKSHLTKVSLALLSAAFLFGCQDQGSEPLGLDGRGPEFHHRDGHTGGGGGNGDGSALEVTFTIDDAFPLSDPTFTTSGPTPVNHKLWASINAINAITVGNVKMVSVAAYPRVKAGKVTEIEMYFLGEDGTTYNAGRLPVDPPESILDDAVFTLHLHAEGVKLRDGNGPNSPILGTVSIADAVYTPVP